MDGTEDEIIFENDCDDDELDINVTHPDVTMRENNFKELLENSDNDLENLISTVH